MSEHPSPPPEPAPDHSEHRLPLWGAGVVFLSAVLLPVLAFWPIPAGPLVWLQAMVMVFAWIALTGGAVTALAGHWPEGLILTAAAILSLSSGILHHPTLQASREAAPMARPVTDEEADAGREDRDAAGSEEADAGREDRDAAGSEERLFSALRLLHANLRTGNTRIRELASRIMELDPDIVSLHEINEAQLEQLTRTLDLQYVRGFPRSDSFGWAILSRYEFEAIGSLGEGRYPAEAIRIENGPDDVVVITVHPPPPINRELELHLRELLRDMSSEIDLISAGPGDTPPALILAGDLNAVPWYRPLYHFVRESRLRYGHPATGPTAPATFPSWLPLLPIDHVLARNVAAAAIRPQDIPGSDHIGLVADVWLTPRS